MHQRLMIRQLLSCSLHIIQNVVVIIVIIITMIKNNTGNNSSATTKTTHPVVNEKPKYDLRKGSLEVAPTTLASLFYASDFEL